MALPANWAVPALPISARLETTYAGMPWDKYGNALE
jgi:hypothetical protein